jgi:uncharacterized membrane protein
MVIRGSRNYSHCRSSHACRHEPVPEEEIAMSTLSIKTHEAGAAMPGVRRVEAARPFLWLRRGWHDMTRSWPWSLGLGIAFTGLGWLLLEWVVNRAHLAMTLTTGYLLVAPYQAIGF